MTKWLLMAMAAVTAFMGYMALLIAVADWADSIYRAGHAFLAAVIGVNATLLWLGLPFVVWLKLLYRRYPPTNRPVHAHLTIDPAILDEEGNLPRDRKEQP